MKNKIKILFIGLMLLVPQQLFAAYETEFIPFISISETYDDNIDLENTDEKDDWITSISPGFTYNILSQKNNFSLNYSPSFIRYKDNDENNTTRHSGGLTFRGEMSRNLLFDISETYVLSEDPLEETEGIVGIRETRNTYQRNSWDSSINYTFGPSNSFLLGFRHSWLENDDIELDDGKTIDPYSRFSYWFNQKHGMELNLGYTDADFSRDDNGIPDDDYSGGSSGLRYLYRKDPHSTFSISYDYNYRDFSGLNNEEDYAVHEASLGFEKQLSQSFSYHISAGYFIQDLEYSEDESGSTFDISMRKDFNRGNFTLGAVGGWDEVYLEAERRGFTKYQQVESEFNYDVTENLINYSRISYRQDKDSTARKSKTIRVSYGWRWLFSRHFSAILDYSRATRNDDRDSEDYSVNRVRLGIEWRQSFR